MSSSRRCSTFVISAVTRPRTAARFGGAPRTAAIRRALHLLAEPGAVPLVFHCAAGKDRTGVVAALTLSLLGVSDDDIATDYSLSRLGMDRMSAWLRDTNPQWAEQMATQPTAFLQSPSDAMHLF